MDAPVLEFISGHHLQKKFMAKRGDVFYANIPVTKEKTVIQKGNRPILIISCEEGNDSSMHYNYLALTSIDNKVKANIPSHVRIGMESGVKRDSIVLVEQPMSIDDEDLKFHIGRCPDYKMEEICDALERQLVLGKYRNKQNKVGVINELGQAKLSEDEQAKKDREEKEKKERAKKKVTYLDLISAINLLNEMIYDEGEDSIIIVKKRDIKIFELKEFLSKSSDDFKRTLKSRIKHYTKIEKYL